MANKTKLSIKSKFMHHIIINMCNIFSMSEKLIIYGRTGKRQESDAESIPVASNKSVDSLHEPESSSETCKTKIAEGTSERSKTGRYLTHSDTIRCLSPAEQVCVVCTKT